MKPFKVGAAEYQARALSAFDQLHVARKLGSVLIFLGSMKDNPDKTPNNYARAMVAAAAPLGNEEVDWAIAACLSSVQRKQQGGWAEVRAQSGKLMFDDVDLLAMMEIVWNVLDQNGLIDFFYVAPSSSSEPETGREQS
jgi:hypothetical protein